MNAQTKPPLDSGFRRLNEARRQFHQLELKKTGRNTFANYNYFELGDFLIPALQIFEEVGLCGVISFDAELARMKVVNVDSPGEPPIEFTSPMGSAALKGCHEVQNIGAVETYQRRYLWVTALEIVEHDALDASPAAGGQSSKSAVNPPSQPTITGDQLAKLEALIPAAKVNPGTFNQTYGITQTKNLPVARFDEAVERLEKRLAALAQAETNKEAANA